MSENRVNPLHLITTGAATAVGGYAEATLAAVQARIANIAAHPYMLDVRGEPYSVAMAPYLDPEMQGTSRFNALLNYALSDACADLSLPSATPLVLCLPHEHRAFTVEQARSVVQQLEYDCAGLRMSRNDVVQQGHAAAYQALTQAQRYLEHHEFCILAAVDSRIDSNTLNWLDSQNAIYSEDNAYGFIPGEAASCIVLCTQQTLEKRSLKSLGCITAFTDAREPVHHTLGVCTGQGLSNAIRHVLTHCSPEQKISHTICDLNGQPHRSDEYGFTLTRCSRYFDNPDDFTAPADCWGDVGAATGVLQIILATAHTTKKANSPILLWASSLHDLRGAALFQPMNTEA